MENLEDGKLSSLDDPNFIKDIREQFADEWEETVLGWPLTLGREGSWLWREDKTRRKSSS